VTPSCLCQESEQSTIRILEEAMKKLPEEAGISRYGQPEEIAELLGFMVSPAAKWMTGASVRMDGGEVKGV
jgi:3-oxoacyl-[acyl-carrier protein] reductase